MKDHPFFLLLILAVVSCTSTEPIPDPVTFDEPLAAELKRMADIDQLAAGNAFPPEGYEHLSQEDWRSFKDSIYQIHQKQLAELFDQYGYLGIDRVGEEGEKHFWLMVQHSDHVPAFQQKVLDALPAEVADSNAQASHLALLTDRVRINNGQKQLYGTQVQFIPETGWTLPKPLADSATVNERRLAIGMEPIEAYLNQMSELHFMLNGPVFEELGMSEAPRLEVPDVQ